MAEPLSYTPEEVAKILKITRFTVYEMIKRGDLRAYRIGRKVRVEAADLEQFIRSGKSGTSRELAETTAKTGQAEYLREDELILCGQDIILDILARHLQQTQPQLRVLRSYIGSIDGLLAMYNGRANAVSVHLWDSDSDTYNTPYVRRFLTGFRTIVINLAFRLEGFYVSRGNPKDIADWRDLTRADLRFVNRERGSGARVLLDEKLRQLHMEPERIQGYDCEERSHLAVASHVARGGADVGLGIEKAALQVREIEFIPLQKERYDLVIRKSDREKPPFAALLAILRSRAFRDEVQGMGGYDLSRTGEIVAEI